MNGTHDFASLCVETWVNSATKLLYARYQYISFGLFLIFIEINLILCIAPSYYSTTTKNNINCENPVFNVLIFKVFYFYFIDLRSVKLFLKWH